MNYSLIESRELNEKMYVGTHESGLGVFVVPKRGCTKKYATFAAKCGSVNNCFVPLGESEPFSIPDGVAHFLEHKMFEQSDGSNAFDLFAKYGANANAYTSFNYTCYLFSCTQNFNESFRHLLNYVQQPYFTDENVEKEQGIIAQEIRMYDDDGSWKAMFNLLKALYHENPVRIDIAGTVESIAEINKDILYKCYNTFYNPSNMVVCVVGDVDVDEVFRAVDESVTPGKMSGEVKNIFKPEPKSVCTPKITAESSVSIPIFDMGFKDNNLKFGDELLRREIAVDIISAIIAGRSSELFAGMYADGIINDSFGVDNTIEPQFANAVFCGESDNPDEVVRRISARIAQICEKGIDRAKFESVKRAYYGNYLRGFNNVQTIGTLVTRYILNGINIFNFTKIFDTVTPEYATEVLNEIFLPENMAVSVVYPSKK